MDGERRGAQLAPRTRCRPRRQTSHVRAARTAGNTAAQHQHLAPTFYHSFTLHDDHLVTADGIGEIQLSDPDDVAWQLEVFTRMQQAALDPQASRAVLDGLAARFATR